MAFASNLIFEFPVPPPKKREDKGGPCWLQIYSYTNGASDSGGVIGTGGVDIIFAAANSSTGADGIQVQQNVTNPGEITLTTTLDYDGYVIAIVRKQK